MSDKKQKTNAQITNVTAKGNNDGAYIGASGKITHDVTPNTQVYVEGNIGRSQSFRGHGGQTGGGGAIGITYKF